MLIVSLLQFFLNWKWHVFFFLVLQLLSRGSSVRLLYWTLGGRRKVGTRQWMHKSWGTKNGTLELSEVTQSMVERCWISEVMGWGDGPQMSDGSSEGVEVCQPEKHSVNFWYFCCWLYGWKWQKWSWKVYYTMDLRLVRFYGVSTFLGYLMPDNVYTNINICGS